MLKRMYFKQVMWLSALLFLVMSVQTNHTYAKTYSSVEEFPQDLTELSIEDLMNLEVTTFSRKAQKLSNTAAAVFVITQEDIRRSGAVNIPEALRMVPGLQVARIDANKWAITSRGFNGRFANKLLVLMDGRTVYTPFFSGVFWDVQDTLMEDIERIEIIRGPGASAWGANAVNGVINVITKHSKDTTGGLISGGVGTEEKGFGNVRYGGKISDKAHVRLYAKYFRRDRAVYSDNTDAADEWHVARGGFRADWGFSDKNSLTVQGDIYDGETGQNSTTASLTPPYSINYDEDTEIDGGNILARWEHIFSKTSDMALKIYYDQASNQSVIGGLDAKTLDIDLQHQFALADRHEIMWGVGYRLIKDDLRNTFNVVFEPEKDSFHLFSAFIQDDITFVPDKWRLTVGSKFEHNDYTGYEIQPTARILWTPDHSNSIWGSVSRAVRTPSRAESDSRVNAAVIPPGVPGNPGVLPVIVTNFGSDEFDSEDLLAFEVGYRAQPMEKLTLDTAVFYNIYKNLRTTETGTSFVEPPSNPSRVVLPVYMDNKMKGETYGFELAVDWKPLGWWRLQTAYTYLEMDLELEDDSTDTAFIIAEDENPQHQVSLRSSTDLPKDLEFDLWARFVDSLPAQDIDGYITLDARLGWHPTESFEIAVVGQNLLDNHHPEFRSELIETASTEVERSVYVKITFRL